MTYIRGSMDYPCRTVRVIANELEVKIETRPL